MDARDIKEIDSEQLELIRQMISEATLESELEWREWAKRQLQLQMKAEQK